MLKLVVFTEVSLVRLSLLTLRKQDRDHIVRSRAATSSELEQHVC